MRGDPVGLPGPFRTLVVSSPNLFRDLRFREKLLDLWRTSGALSPVVEASGTLVEAMDDYRGKGRLWRNGQVLWIKPPYQATQVKWKEMQQVIAPYTSLGYRKFLPNTLTPASMLTSPTGLEKILKN